MGTAYGQKPSSYFQFDDWVAYDLDLACLNVGREIEYRIRKKLPIIWDDQRSDKEQGKRSFGRLGVRARKVKIPESGIW